ncbi:heat shock 70 kDa protein 14-like isoform X1 [Mya arenaria]|uniref:heat shock 70 kDa protein 14-like isoform X1 n=2 Tax=Mya arenaria TaxID=6604 RepID=UPI0022DFE4D9|nr:heat shock 70 kDa protein 14-like isoform X1 [Mya arenaria]
MSAAYGVHFGCSSACLAVNRDDKTEVIANDLGDRTTPSIVAFTEHEQAVGQAAKQGMIRNLQNTVCHVKQILGRRFDDPVVTQYKRTASATVLDKNGDPMYEVDYKESRKMFTPSHIAVTIYKKMLETAQSHGGLSGSQDSVLAVPPHFTAEQKKAISSAANQAGFNILRLINEPSAAVLAYDIGQADSHYSGCVLVFRLGGVSAETSVVKVHNGMYQLVATVTEVALGGDRCTDALASFLIAEFKRQSRCDISDNKRALAKLHHAAETCKHTLSKMENALCAVDSLYDGLDFNTKVSRARFESCVTGVIQKCSQFIDQVLTDAHLTRTSIDKVILCGGGCNMPLLQKAVADMFSHCDILNSINPEEVIAIGAAKQAGLLSDLEDEDIKLNNEDRHIDCISKPICIKCLSETGPELVPVFSELAPLHSRKHLDFNLPEKQTSFCLEVCEGSKVDDVVLLAKIVMKDLPEGAKVNSTFHLRRDGHLHITCTESTTNKTESVTVEPS